MPPDCNADLWFVQKRRGKKKQAPRCPEISWVFVSAACWGSAHNSPMPASALGHRQLRTSPTADFSPASTLKVTSLIFLQSKAVPGEENRPGGMLTSASPRMFHALMRCLAGLAYPIKHHRTTKYILQQFQLILRASWIWGHYLWVAQSARKAKIHLRWFVHITKHWQNGVPIRKTLIRLKDQITPHVNFFPTSTE